MTGKVSPDREKVRASTQHQQCCTIELDPETERLLHVDGAKYVYCSIKVGVRMLPDPTGPLPKLLWTIFYFSPLLEGRNQIRKPCANLSSGSTDKRRNFLSADM